MAASEKCDFGGRFRDTAAACNTAISPENEVH